MFKRLKLLLLSSGTARILCIILLLILASAAAAVFSSLAKRPPALQALLPEVISDGEVLSIEGKGFGDERDRGWVEVSGARLSSSALISWSDNLIEIIVPENYSDGLIRVHTENGASNALVFSKEENIPRMLSSARGAPAIQQISPQQGKIGSVLAIRGLNFGSMQENSAVLFTKTRGTNSHYRTEREGLSLPLIAQDDLSLGYELWSDNEIRVHVPDGAASGPLYVQTGKGMSSPVDFTITEMPGTKTFANQRVFLISVNVQLTNIEASSGSKILVRLPIPLTTAAQQNVRLQTSSRNPYMENYSGTIIHQLENVETENRVSINHSFTLTNCDILTDIDASQVAQYDASSTIYRAYTAPDSLVPSDAAQIAATLASVAGANNTNPYRKAQAIYGWLLENIRPRTVPDRARSPIEALRTGTGDSYDLAILFCAMARASGIPAVPVAGIVIDPNLRSSPHWWAEFYVESFGWVPVDLGMAKGVPYKAEYGGAETPEWYFGNLDGNRVAFSRGFNNQEPMIENANIVGYPRSFAFQRIWEEATESVTAYTSLWGVPQPAGIY